MGLKLDFILTWHVADYSEGGSNTGTVKHVRNANQDQLTFGSSSIHHAMPGAAASTALFPSSRSVLSSTAR